MHTFRASWNLGSSYSVILGIHILGSSYSVSMVLHFFFFMEAKTEISRVGIDEWKMEARIQIDGHVFLHALMTVTFTWLLRLSPIIHFGPKSFLAHDKTIIWKNHFLKCFASNQPFDCISIFCSFWHSRNLSVP